MFRIVQFELRLKVGILDRSELSHLARAQLLFKSLILFRYLQSQMGLIDEGNRRVLTLLDQHLCTTLMLRQNDTVEQFGPFP